MNLRALSFIVSILGIAFLLGLLIFPNYVEADTLEGMIVGEKVIIEGVVTNERDFGGFVVMDVSGIAIVCECDRTYSGVRVAVEGVVEEYRGERQVRVLRIETVG